jgi:uncharacterized membrane protein YjdF
MNGHATESSVEETGARERVEPSRRASHRTIALFATLVFIAISFWPQGLAKYRYSFLFMTAITWGVYALRERLLLSPALFAAFAAALLLHDLGAFGMYQRHVLGIQYDWYVHFYFGLVGATILARILAAKLSVRGFPLALMTVMMMGGMGAIHEIVECASTVFLGKDVGMLNVGADDPYDTQEDMLNNIVGASVAVAVFAWRSRKRVVSR